MDRILLWAVQSQDQWRSISSLLNCPHTDTEDDHPTLRREVEAAVRITEEREVSWSWQHPNRTGLCRWRGHNYRSHDSLPQDLADRRMANPTDLALSHYASQERQPAAVPELPTDQPHQPPKSCWRSYWTDWSRRQRRSLLKNRQASEQEGAPQSRSSTQESSVRSISSTSKTCSHVFVDFKMAFEVQHQRQSDPSHQTPLW